MILVDTSVWVDYFKGTMSATAMKLDRYLDTEEIVVGDLVLVEVLQGLREGNQLKLVQAAFASFRLVPLCGADIAHRAAANYRSLRRQGITIRGTIDVIIATWCIENDALLLHNDRDFGRMKALLGLREAK